MCIEPQHEAAPICEVVRCMHRIGTCAYHPRNPLLDDVRRGAETRA